MRRHTGVQVYSGINLERRYAVPAAGTRYLIKLPNHIVIALEAGCMGLLINRRDHDYNVNCVYDYEDMQVADIFRPPIYFEILLCI